MKIAKLLPADQRRRGLINYSTGGNQRQYQIPVKVDYNISSKQSIFARYMLSNNYTPLFYDPSDLFTGSTTGQSDNPVHHHRRQLRHQRDLPQQHAHHGKPQRQPALHSQFPNAGRFRHFRSRRSSVGNGRQHYRRSDARRRCEQSRLLQDLWSYSGAEDLTLVLGKHHFQWRRIHPRLHACANTRGVKGNLNFTGQYLYRWGNHRIRICRFCNRAA